MHQFILCQVSSSFLGEKVWMREHHDSWFMEIVQSGEN